MNVMNNKKLYIWGIAALFAFVVFFCGFPYLSHFVLCYVYGVANAEAVSCKMQNFGLVGDSYGIYNALFSALAFFGVIYTIYYQQKEGKKAALVNRFYTMLDYQSKLIDDMRAFPVRIKNDDAEVKLIFGRKVFVEYKIQLKYLMRAVKDVSEEEGFNLSQSDMADIAYAVFYYGSSPSWREFMKEYLRDYQNREELVDGIIEKLNSKKYKRYALSRPNQNYLSVYFRNMYNTIKVIDSTSLLKEEEKKDYIKMLRAQLCNAELYVLFFNLLSRFGHKWIEHDYVSKYEIIQNLPSKYCDGYNPKDYFCTIQYEGEQRTLSTFHEIIVPREE